MKLVLFILCSTFSLVVSAQANWNDNSFVHRSGRQILDGNNTPIRLEGVNLGGWLLWEGWIWGTGFTQEKTIYNRMKNKVGQASADAFREAVYQHYITRKDIEAISNECFNLIRLPFNHTILEDDDNPFVYKQSGWNLLDSVLDWCEDNNLYVLFDMHSAPGGQSPYFVTDPDSPNMWADVTYQTRTAELWKAIANRYKDRGIVAGYDLLNEPAAPSDSALLQLYDQVIAAIRSVDTHHMLFIEGKTASTDFDLFTSLPDPNVVFAFHFYSWFVWNIPNALNEFVTVSQNLDVPVMCGEWGENSIPPLTTTQDFFKDPAKQISGETFWTWKKHITGSSHPYYVGIDSTALWNKSIKWITNGFNPQPTVLEMQQGMAEFIQNMQFQNCLIDQSMSDLLKACQPASVESNGAASYITVTPNPADQEINITVSAGIEKLNIYNAMGQLVEVIPVSASACKLATSNYQNGIYFIGSDRFSGSQKLIIQH